LKNDDTLLLVLETSLDAVIVMRTDGSIAEWNAEAEQIFGWSRAEALDQPLGKLIVPPQYRQAHADGLSHYLASGEGPVLRRRIEITGLTRDGVEIPIELSITPISATTELLFLAFVRDISGAKAAFAAMERKAMEASLLHRVASHAAESASLDETMTLALDAICELLDWPIGHAFLVRSDAELLHSHLWVGDTAGFETLKTASQRVQVSPGVGLPGRAWASRQPEWVEEIDGQTKFVRGTAAELGIWAALAIPIVTDDKVVAILEFFSPRPRPIDPGLVLTARILGEQVGRALERHQARERQALVLGELEHRTKNMLAVVSSMAAQTARSVRSLEDYSRQFGERLASLAAAYGLLTRTHWQATPLNALIGAVVGPHLSPESPQLQLTGDDVVVPARMALSLSMVLHELTTNAIKYGALSGDAGRIHIRVSRESSDHGAMLSILWTETGVGTCAKPDKSGFGSRLIERVVRRDLGGTLSVDYPASGAVYALRVPLPPQD
jgi:PAS domain S-box-containing protein